MKRLILLTGIIFFVEILSFGQNKIKAYEYWLDDNFASKTSVNITPQQKFELNSIPSPDIPNGMHIFNIRFIDNNNYYTPLISSVVFGSSGGGSITSYEYWFDDNYAGVTAKTLSPPQKKITLSLDQIVMPKQKTGMHVFNIRFKNNRNLWTGTISQFYIISSETHSQNNYITELQYFYNNDTNKIYSLNLKTPVKKFDYNFQIADIPLLQNMTYLNYRFRDTLNRWSAVMTLPFKPVARFEALRQTGVNNFAVNFNNISIFGKDCLWDFGDGLTSTMVNPSHIYKEAGKYKVSLTVKNAEGIDKLEKTIMVYSLDKVESNHAGNTGFASIYAYGCGFKSGTKFYLKSASNVILTGDTVLFPKPGVIMSGFDFTGKSLGVYDVYVEIPGDTTMVIKNGFTIEQGKQSAPWVETTGKNNVLPGSFNEYTINYGNNGNNDINGVVLWLTINDDPGIELDMGDISVVQSQYTNDRGLNSAVDSIPMYFKTDSLFGKPAKTRVYPFYVPMIPAGSNNTATIKIKIPGNQTCNLNAWMSNPFYKPTLDASVSNSYHSVLWNNVVDIDTVKVPSISHIDSISQRIWDTKKSYQYEKQNTWGSWLWNTAVTNLDCSVDVKNAGDIAREIGTYLVNMDKNIDAITDCSEIYNNNTSSEKIITASAENKPANETSGPDGYGDNNFIGGKTFPYSIYFENKDTARTAIHQVCITDTIDMNKFDIKTFSFGPFSIADTTVSSVKGTDSFTLDIDMRPEKNIITRVSGNLDTLTGIIKWTFVTLDPLTMDYVTTDADGFLPPDKLPPEGEANVSFSVELKPEVKNNEIIRNETCIVYNYNKSKQTNEYLNTTDFNKPSGRVLDLAAITNEANFKVSWTATDAESGVRDYSVYVLVNDTALLKWQHNTSKTSDIFKGRDGYKYKFYSIATDSAGNSEDVPANFDAFTSVETISISGLLQYDNTAKTPVRKARIFLYTSEGSLKDSTNVDNDGKYGFNNVKDGSYTLKVKVTADWGGSDPGDALLVNRYYIGAVTFQNDFRQKAADVNLDNDINPGDALLINRRYIGAVSSFVLSDWLYQENSITVSGVDVVYNLKVICAGDPNGSHEPY